MPVHELAPELAMLLAAIGVVLFASFAPRPHQGLNAPLAGAGLVAAAVALVRQLDTDAHLTFSGIWAVDGVSIWARLLIVAATLVCVPLAPRWLERDRRHGEYYAVLLFGAVGACLMAAAADTMELVMGVLLSSVSGYTLAAYHRDWDASVEAGMKYFLVGAMANAVLLIGVVWLFGLAGSTGYGAMAAAVADSVTNGTSAAAWLTATALVVAGLAFKLGALPAHTWMPDVAQGAPAPSAAFLTVVPKIGAAAALARLGDVFAPHLHGWTPLLAGLAAATMTFGNLAALAQTDLRRLLGWSSVSQSGYALVGVALVGVSSGAVTALLFFLAAYSAANLAAFAAVTELRGRTALRDYRGLADSRPGIMVALTLALLSLVGIPPLAGFVGKTLLMLEAVEGGYAWLAAAVVANTVISLYYYLRVIAPMYFERAASPAAVLGMPAAAAMWAAALLVVLLGPGGGALLSSLSRLSLLP